MQLAGLAVVVGLVLPLLSSASASAETFTFGKTSVGAFKEGFGANRKRANSFALPTAGAVSQLSIYLQPTAVSGQQSVQGVIYADSKGAPGAILAASNPITFASTQVAGWYALALPSALELPAGNYWLGALTGTTAGVAAYRFDQVTGSRALNQNLFSSGPSNPFGSSSRDNQQMSLYATFTPTGNPSKPVNTAPPTISGTSQQGQTLTVHNGAWTSEPTNFTHQWLQCNSLGTSCLPISGATGQTYVPVAADVGHTLVVEETASNANGPGNPATSSPSAVVAPLPPGNTSPPTIGGTPQQGQTLTEAHGTWTNEPTAFAYQWQQCDGSGANCRNLVGATRQTYVVSAADVAHTIRVLETASNSGGPGAPATSGATAVITPQGSAATFGKTTVGALRDSGMRAEFKIVHKAALSSAGSMSKLSVYAVPGLHSSSPQVLKGLIFADSGGSPGALIATGTEVTYRGSVNGAGWFDLPFASPVSLAPGTYWIGFIDGPETQAIGYLYDKVSASRAYNANVYASGPSDPFGTATKDNEQASIYATYTPSATKAPENMGAPAIAGEAKQGKTLSASNGTWTGSPTSFTYEWERCDSAGANCKAITGAAANSYVLVQEDVGKTLRVLVTAKNEAGPSAPATSAQSEVVAAATKPPENTGAPTITGEAKQGKTLTEVHGKWSGEPTGFTYQWLRCSSSATECAAISGATNQTYLLVAADVGHKLKVEESASNAGGPSEKAATSEPTAVVVPTPPANETPPTITGEAKQGKTLTEVHGKWSGEPTGFTYQWQRCNSSGAECVAISGATGQTYPVGSEDVAHTLRVAETASNAGGPSEKAAISAQSEVVAAATKAPENMGAPAISGEAKQGKALSASNGTWTGSPTSFTYEWERCDSAGANCKAITGAAANSYVLVEEDVGKTLRVLVTAKNEAGPSAPATSAQSEVVAAVSGTVSHLEYVLQDGVVSVYDTDHEFKLLKTFTLPQKFEIRGVSVAPATHLMFVMYGGDGPGNGNGSVLAYDLVSEKPVWEVHLSTGIDSGQVSPDGSKLYVPSGEQNTTTGIWNVLSTTNGELIGTIKGGNGPHNTVVSNNGRYVYLGSRNYNFLDVYETETGKIKEIGPLVGTVRPLTVNGSNTLAFTTATGFAGFQISSVITGKVLFTEKLAEFPKEFPFTTASHGIGMSPDEKQLYVLDAVNKEVQFWDISKVTEGVAPAQIGVVPLSGLSGKESPCVYDCGRDGWIQVSRDGRYIYIGDSGEVIETATRNIVTTLPTLAQTKKSIEVDWQSGVPIATSGRTGVGQL